MPLKNDLITTPSGKILFFKDRFRNKNARIKMTIPHKQVKFVAKSLVDVRPYYFEVSGNLTLPLDTSSLSLDVRPFLLPSLLVNPSMIKELAPDIIKDIHNINEALVTLTAWVTKKIKYEPNFTSVTTLAPKTLEIGVGVFKINLTSS